MKKILIAAVLLFALSFSLLSCGQGSGVGGALSPDSADPIALEMIAPDADPNFAVTASIVGKSLPTKSVSSVVSFVQASQRTLSSSEIYRLMTQGDKTYVLFEYSYEQLKPFSIDGENRQVETVKGSECKEKGELAPDFACQLNPASLPMTANCFSGVNSIYIESSDTLTLTANVSSDKINDFLGVTMESGCAVSVIFISEVETETLLSLTLNISYPDRNKLTVTSDYSYDVQTFEVQ